MKIGYARVSTQDQNFDLQIDALEGVGCEKIFKEKVSGVKAHRPELEKMLSELRENDVVYIYKLDRLGRSMKDLIALVEKFRERNVSLVSITNHLDTTSSQGKLMFNLFATLAEFERDLIRDRTMSGLEAARARGRKGGRPTGLSDQAKSKAIMAAALYKDEIGVDSIAKQLGISKATLYKYLRHQGITIGGTHPVKK